MNSFEQFESRMKIDSVMNIQVGKLAKSME